MGRSRGYLLRGPPRAAERDVHDSRRKLRVDRGRQYAQTEGGKVDVSMDSTGIVRKKRLDAQQWYYRGKNASKGIYGCFMWHGFRRVKEELDPREAK
jgi:hypothetical protein